MCLAGLNSANKSASLLLAWCQTYAFLARRLMLVRARVVSFLSGFAVAGCICLYQLRQDIWESHKLLASQVGRASVQPYVSPNSVEEAVFGRLGSVERFIVVIIVRDCRMDAA